MSRAGKEVEVRRYNDITWQSIRHNKLYCNLRKEYEEHLRRRSFEAAYALELEIAAKFSLVVSPPHPDQSSLVHTPRPFFPAAWIRGQDGGVYYIVQYLGEKDEIPRGAIAIPQLPGEADTLLSILLRHRSSLNLELDMASYPQHIIQIEQNHIREFIKKVERVAGVPQKRHQKNSEAIKEAFQALELHQKGKTWPEIAETIWPKEHAAWVNRFGLRKEEELTGKERTRYSDRLEQLLFQSGHAPDEAERIVGREFRLISSNPRKRNPLEKRAQRRYELALKLSGDK